MLRDPAVNYPRSQRLAILVALLASLALMAPIAWPIVSGQIFARDDLGRFHLPVRAFYASCLRDGDSPLWHPGLYCGFYIHGEGQGGFDYPIHHVIYRALPLTTAFSIEVFLGYPVMFAGMLLWLRRLDLGTLAAFFGAMSLTFSEFLILRYVHLNAIQIVAHLPWVLLAIEGFRPSRGSSLAIALLTASQGLLGYPQYLGFCLIVETLYALVRYRRSPKILVAIGLSMTLGLLMASAQLIPHLDALASSNRSKPTLEFLGMNSLHPMNLFSIIVPFAFRQGWYNPVGPAGWPRHESVAYLGVFLPASIVWLWIRRRDLGSMRSVVTWAICIGITALVLSVGRFSPLFSLYAKIPGASLFRGPSRYILIAQFAASVLSAVAISDLVQPRDRPSWRSLSLLLWPVGIGVLAMAVLTILAIVPTTLNREQIGGSREMIVSVLMIVTACGLIAIAARNRGASAVLVAIILLATFDSWTHGISPLIRHETKFEQNSNRLPLTTDRLVSQENIGLIESSRLVGGYVALTPFKVLDYHRPKAIQVAGARWELDARKWSQFAVNPLPRVRLVTLAQISRDPKNDLELIDPTTTALVASAMNLPSGLAGDAEITIDRPGQIEVRTTCSARRLLVVSESYHSGWEAEIHGRPTSLLRVNGDFFGCVVEPGVGVIRFRFNPASARIGRSITLASLVIAVGLLFWLRFRVRSTPVRVDERTNPLVLDFEGDMR